MQSNQELNALQQISQEAKQDLFETELSTLTLSGMNHFGIFTHKRAIGPKRPLTSIFNP